MSVLSHLPFHLLQLAAMLAVAWIPGLLWIAVAQKWWAVKTGELTGWLFTPLTSLALAPAVTFGFISVAAVVFSPSSPLQLASLTWTKPVVFTYLAALGLIAAVILAGLQWLATKRGRPHSSPDCTSGGRSSLPRLPRLTLPTRLRFWVIVGAIFIAVAPLFTFDLFNPLQQWDPSFHANSVWVVVTTHDASPLGGLSPMYGRSAHGIFYPSIWHGFVSLFASVDLIIPTINVSSAALVVWWIVGMGALAEVVWSDSTRALLAVVIGACTISFPADFISAYAQWPNATSMALTPGIVAALMVLGRQVRDAKHPLRALIPLTVGIIVVLAACVGGVGVHPITFFNVLLLVAVMLISGTVRLTRRLLRERAWLASAVVLLTAAATVVVAAGILLSPLVSSTASFQRGTSWAHALTRPLAPFPPFPVTVGLVLTTGVVTLLTFIGLLVVARPAPRVGSLPLTRTPWLALTWLLFAALVLLAYAPDFGLKFLTGPWYCDPRRLMGIMQIPVILLCAAGLEATGRFIRSHGARRNRCHSTRVTAAWLTAGFLVVTLLGAADARWLALRKVYDPDHLGPAGMANSAELNLIRQSRDLLGDDAVIIGDPANGTVYFQVLAGHRVLFPQLSIVDEDESVNLLAWRFKDIHDDPEVCRVLRQEGVTHFWFKPDSRYYLKWRSELRGGFYNVDTSHGFLPVASTGDATLYQITACE